MTLAARIYAGFQLTLGGSPNLGQSKLELSDDPLFASLSSGTSPNQADKAFVDRRVLASSATENLDLAGSLIDAFGVALNFVKVRGIFIKADKANVNDVVVGGAATNGFTGPLGGAAHTVAVKPGGLAMFVAPNDGWNVIAATGDLLKVANGGAGSSVTYNVAIIGTSA